MICGCISLEYILPVRAPALVLARVLVVPVLVLALALALVLVLVRVPSLVLLVLVLELELVPVFVLALASALRRQVVRARLRALVRRLDSNSADLCAHEKRAE